MTTGQAARAVCQNLARDVRRLAPSGLGSWDTTWTLVDAPTAEFMAALSAWQAEPGTRTEARVRAAYQSVIMAWHRAAEVFVRERSGHQTQ